MCRRRPQCRLLGDVAQALPCDRHPRLKCDIKIPVGLVQLSGIGNRARDGKAKKTAVVVRRGGVNPGSCGSEAVVASLQIKSRAAVQ